MSKLSALKKQARRAEERDDFIEAIELYGRAVTEAQEDPSATFEVGLYNRIGDLYLKLDDTSQAVYHYLLAVDQYAEDELYPPAIALCRKVLRVAPDQVDAYRQLARLHEATGLLADAREEMGRYLAGLWEAGQVDGAMDGLPELVGRLMSQAPDLDEIHRLRDEGEAEEAFELLYRQWEDDKAVWSNGNGAGARGEATGQENGGAGFPQTDPSDRGLGDSLRRGWQGLFGGAEDEATEEKTEGKTDEPTEEKTDDATDEPVVLDLREVEAARETAGEEEKGDEADGDAALDDVDDMAWLREVTTSRKAVPAEETGDAAEDEEVGPADVEAADAEDLAAGTDEAGPATADEAEPAAADDVQSAAETDADEVPDEEIDIVAAAMEAPAATDADAEPPAEEPDAIEASDTSEAEPEVCEAEADATEPEPIEAADAGEVEAGVPEGSTPSDEDGVERPAGPPEEVLVAAAASLSRGATARRALTGDVAAPMLLAAADADVPEGRPVVPDRPLDRAVLARLRQPLDRRPGGRPPAGPAFETPGREDYLPAGAEVTGRAPSPGLLWLSDQVALLGAMDRREPLAVRPAFGPPLDVLRSAAEALDRSATVEPVAALPADVAAPALLGAGVSEEPWVAEPVVEDTPRRREERRPPAGPAFETPGRDDYLPAGAEISARLPAAALSWLADAVDHLHRLEWGEPDWMTAAREAKSRAAAALSDLTVESAPRAALPADLGGPLLLAPADEDARAADAVAEDQVDDGAVPAAAGDVSQPPAAASGPEAPRPDPEGPSFQTPGRDDYLPAGAETGEGLPTPALAWLAASVADIHRMDWGEPSWFDADAPGRTEADAPTLEVDGIDASEEAAARATQDALALIAADKAVAVPPEEAEEPPEASEEAEVAASEAEAAGDEAVTDGAADAEAAAGVEEPRPAAEADAGDAAGPSVEAAARAAAGPVEEPEPSAAAEPEPERVAYPEPASERGPFDEPDVTPPVEQTAEKPNGLDFTALLQRIGWLRGQSSGGPEEKRSTGAGAEGSSAPRRTDDVMAPWARGPSGDGSTSGDGGRNGDATADLQPPTVGAPGSGVPDFTDLLQKVGWLRQDERT